MVSAYNIVQNNVKMSIQANTSTGKSITIQGFITGDSWLDNKYNIPFL